MPWTLAVIELDGDKVGAGAAEAGQATVTYDDGAGNIFTFSGRIDRANRAEFVTRAKAALAAFTAKTARETLMETNLLNALNQA